MDSEHGLAMKGICANYFETHVSPVLRYMGQSQEHLSTQLQDLRAAVERKANSAPVGALSLNEFEDLRYIRVALQQKADITEVPSLREFEDLVAKVSAVQTSLSSVAGETSSSSGVSTVRRLTKLAEDIQRKADSSAVPTRADLNNVMLEQKAHLKDVATLARTEVGKLRDELEVLRGEIVKEKAEGKSGHRRASDPVVGDGQGGGTGDAAGVSPAPVDRSEIKRIQVIVAAAGARFDKQLRELRQQVRELRAQPLASVDERWPGRSLGPSESFKDPDACSDVGSVVESDAGSYAGSIAGLGPEEKAELRKIQAVVGAAGTAFSKELRDVRGQLRELHTGLRGLKEQLGECGPSSPSIRSAIAFRNAK